MKKISLLVVAFLLLMTVFPLVGSGNGGIVDQTLDAEDIESMEDHANPTDPEESHDLPPIISKTGFIENRGQLDNSRIDFYTTGEDMAIGISSGRLYYRINGDSGYYSYQVDFLGAGNAHPEGIGGTGQTINYFIGEPEDWVTGITSYERVVYRNIYPGIDLLFKTDGSGLKYDMIVHPGGDAEDIRFKYRGAEPVLDSGDLVISTPMGNVIEEAPITFQETGRSVESTYFVDNEVISFEIGEYDRNSDLIIDPGVYFSTFIGGTDEDEVVDVAIDDEGYVYAGGTTKSSGFPTTPGAYETDYDTAKDVFVVKFNKSGDKLIYSTFLGHNSDDVAYGLDVDGDGNAIVVGETDSMSYPTLNAFKSTWGGRTDGFITKLNWNGTSLVYSSLLGGWGDDGARDVIVDSSGNAMVTGQCGFFQNWGNQWQFPTTSGAYDRTFNGNWQSYDAFLMKVSSTGNLDFSTIIGGNGNDYGYAVAFDGDDEYYITGETNSDFPTTTGAYDTSRSGVDMFVSKFNGYGSSLLKSTYLGGDGQERGWGIAVNASEDVFITGETSSSNYPTTTDGLDRTPNGNYDTFVTVLDSGFASLSYSTYIGGSSMDIGQDIKIKDENIAYICGVTQSNNYPHSSDALYRSRQGAQDGIISIIDVENGTMDYSTYFGGGGSDPIKGLDVDDNGLITIGGGTVSVDLVTSLYAFDKTYNTNSDGFVAKFYPADFSPSSLTSTSGYFYVDLEWDMPDAEFFEDFNIIGYRIYRGLNSWSLEHLIDVGNVTTYNDTINYFISREYTYRVTALFETIGESIYTNSIQETPLVTPRPIDPVPMAGDLFVNLSWERIDDGFFSMFDIQYNVYRGLTPGQLTLVRNVGTGNWYNDTDIALEPRLYYYGISYTIKYVGESNMTAIVQAKPNTPPGNPENISITEGDLKMDLSWDAPADPGGSPITGYTIYRGLTSGELVPYSSVNGPATTFTDDMVEPGRVYAYLVKAENRIGLSYGSDQMFAMGQTVPSSPHDPSIIEKDGRITLNWKEPMQTWSVPITGYAVYIEDTSSSRSDVVYLTPDRFTYTDNVMNGEPVSYRITASNIHGEGDPTGYLNGSGRGVPGPAIEPLVTIGDSEVSLHWKGFETDGGSPIKLVKIYQGEDLETRTLVAILPPQTLTHTIDGLFNGRNYYFWISATNANGEGEASIPLQGRPGRIPGQVQFVSVSPMLEANRISWSEPTDIGGRDGLEYNLYRGWSEHSLSRILTLPFETTDHTDVDLDSETNYCYAISITNSFGEGPLSKPIWAQPYGRPSAPEILHHSATSSSITLDWSTPETNGGSNITGFTVEYKPEASQNWDQIRVTTNKTVIGSLIKDITYIIRVRADSTIAEGHPSEEIEQLVGILPEPPSSVSLSTEGKKITVKWTPRPLSTGRVDSYRIYLAVNDGDWNLVEEVSPTMSTLIIDDAVIGNWYTVAISSVNQVGEGALSTNRTSKMIGSPDRITEIWVSSMGADHVLLEWSAPYDDGGSEITGYDIYRGTTSGTMQRHSSVQETLFKDEGVEAGQTYYYYVVAKNSNADSEKGSVILGSTVTVPGKVTGLTESTENDEVVLQWGEPGFDGGSEVTGYVIYRSIDGGDRKFIAELDSSSVGYTDDTVKTGKYRYTVVAVNSIGEGEASHIDTDVPSRLFSSIMIFIISLLIPLIVILMIAFLPGYLKKRKEMKEEEERKRKEEEEMKKVQEAIERERLHSRGLPVSGPIPALNTASTSQLPPAEPQVKEASTGEGYIRPTELKKKRTDKHKVLRADGKSSEQREKEKHLTEIKSQGNGHHKKYEKELKEVLKKESESVFTGQQPMAPPPAGNVGAPVEGEVMEAPMPEEKQEISLESDTVKAPEPSGKGSVSEEPAPEDIKEWNETDLEVDVPLSEPPEEVEDIDDIEEIDDLEEVEELED